jgi:plastocyanin
MRIFLTLMAATVLAGSNCALAQQADPDIRGPLRRGAGAVGEALGTPGVENRIERRQAQRGDLRTDADAWRMRYYNDEWWYYSPQNNWMYYRDNRWTPYDRNAYRPIQPRYSTGYRGVYTSRTDPYRAYDRFAYGKPGTPTLTVAIHDESFEPKSIHIAPGTTVAWVNRGTHDHTVTSQDGNWDSGEIGPDGTYSARFKKPGTYHYLCDLHEGMQGTIVVGDGAGAAVTDENAVDARRRGDSVAADRPATEIDVDRRGVDVDVDRPGADVNVPRDPLPDTELPAPAPQPGQP